MTPRTVTGSARSTFLPRHFGPMGMIPVEARVYHYAGKALRDQRSRDEVYHGGMWAFRECDNGAGYMVPESVPEIVALAPVGEFGGDVRGVTREAAGLALTIIATNHELWRLYEQHGECAATLKLHEAWERLMEVAHDWPDKEQAGKVLLWLD